MPQSAAPSRLPHHLARMRACEITWRGFRLPLATPPGTRYPYVYPRDLAALARAYEHLRLSPTEAAGARASLRGSAEFLLAAQNTDGAWEQRYDAEARSCAIYAQEDNTAHATVVLARHVRNERQSGEASPIEKVALEAITRGLAFSRLHVYRKGINLYYSTTSIHESGMETGYTLWTNGAYRQAYALAIEAAQAAGRSDLAAEWKPRLDRLDENLRRHFVQDGQWIRALTPTGRFDRRPDVTLLSPHYFGFEHLDAEASDRSAQRVERELWDPDLGLLQRYLPFREDKATHLHAGNGPWLAYSAWLAQRHAVCGNGSRARDILHRIEAFATEDGDLPEHVSTKERFVDFMQNEWETGLDFQKEFDRDILLHGIPFTSILREANHMQGAYDAAAARVEVAKDDLIRFAAPLAWSHAEFAVALALLGDA